MTNVKLDDDMGRLEQNPSEFIRFTFFGSPTARLQSARDANECGGIPVALSLPAYDAVASRAGRKSS